jgi:membrane-associated phospholipid phosphatase
MEKLRYKLLEKVAAGTPIIEKLQKRRNPLLDKYFMIASYLGDTGVYVVLLPWFHWYLDPHLGRLYMWLLFVGTIVGNLGKNLMALPRPPSHLRLKKKQLLDFGLPSTHSLNATSLSLFLVYWIWSHTQLPATQFNKALGITITLLWIAVSTCVSRLYLGVHSPLDIGVGASLGAMLVTVWIMIHEWFDKMLALAAESDVVVLSFVVTTLMIILLHPRSTRPTPSFKGTISLSGLATGVTLGLRNGVVIRTMLQLTSCPRHVSNLILNHQPDWSWLHAELWVAFFRVLLGVAIILLVYFVTKLILLVILGSILNLWGVTSMVDFVAKNTTKLAIPHPAPLDNLDYPQFVTAVTEENAARLTSTTDPDKEKKHDAKLVAEYFSCIFVGIAVVVGIPVLFDCIGL